ncbi:Uma2 family endonuclease [Rubrivirga sp.]|uniref:Uma2 family endonuclease n=1 Tax=Rubrivirga sp. TaxID=1885344 RepID=UPI003B529F6E
MPAVAPRRSTAPASTPEAGEAPVAGFYWTRERYDQAVEAGVFGPDDKVELIEGQIVPKMPQNTPHSVATSLTAAALRTAFGTDFYAQEEKPIALSDRSEPEPDVAVVRGGPRAYLDDHPGPDAILLIVEVADTSLVKDQVRMARLYAQAGVAEYWIINLHERVLEVHRDPVGGTYGTKTTLGAEGVVSPVHAPDASVAVADLLP